MKGVISEKGEAGKISPVMIFIIVLGAGVLVIGLAVLLAGAFLFHKAKEAGLDSDLFNENPGIAVARMAAAMNPNVEVVSVDEDSGSITLYDKESGKTVTLDLEQVANGKISFETDDGEATTVEVTQQEGEISTKSADTTFDYGNVELPQWIRIYPGATLQGGVSKRGAEGTSGYASIVSTDTPDEVRAFYEESLRKEGLEVNTVSHQDSAGSGSVVNAEDAQDGRRVTVLVGTNGQETTASITFSREG
jgi:hypothetical protein